ncbi:MAG: pentapeptide repeat-containing protein [Bifidobacterium psychraerophilum]|uniref:pentapeptide repeat-containing protein n=1 Tax=Bifidobacterium psychraerophilum TaxID=218140 RepID=UPI0039ED8799
MKNPSWKLFLVILFWCGLGAWGVYGAWILWSQIGLKDPAPHATASLAVVGGVGGVVALVIAFRKQSSAERGEGQDRLNESVRLLGDSQPSTRIAGVYAIINTGKRHRDLREQAADILCGYLRTTRPADDAPVESTIVHRLQDVLRRDNPEHWKNIDIDLHGATITVPFELNYCVIANADLSHTTFRGLVSLNGVEFVNYALFQKAVFMGKVSIRSSTFRDGADFSESVFHNLVYFDDSEFLSQRPKPKMTNDDHATTVFYHCALFNAVHFHGVTSFERTRFVTDCDFSGLIQRLPAGRGHKTNPTIFGLVGFIRTKFLARASFHRIKFTNQMLTEDVEFRHENEKTEFYKRVAASRK